MIALDVGTSYIIAARYKSKDEIEYTEIRDAFFRIKPSSPISASMIEKGLAHKKYFKDSDGSFIVVGQDAIDKAIERNTSALRPMHKGIIAPTEKDARRILKFILGEVLGKPVEKNEKLIYCVPAQPIDVSGDDFDISYHEDALNLDLKDLGYTPFALNEAEAICYSELADDDYTGIAISMGAGMQNIAVMSSGEVVLKFSISRSGDWIDHMAAISTAQPDSVIQVEKENSKFVIGTEVPHNPILSAVSTYYVRLIDYVVKNLALRLSNSKDLPRFTKPLSIVIAGGTSKAKGLIEQFNKSIGNISFPLSIKEVRLAGDSLHAVARGLLIAGDL